MGILISQLDTNNIKHLDTFDSEFIINSKIVPHYENGELSYTIFAVPEYKKHYEPEKRDYSDYVNNDLKTAYIAFLDGKAAGQIILRDNWNRFALIEDIRVDVKYRRRGIGRELLKAAETWARYRGFPGIMLETQDTNVGACRFYKKYGFVFGGFDTSLYRAAYRYADEIALFWYLIFPSSTPPPGKLDIISQILP